MIRLLLIAVLIAAPTARLASAAEPAAVPPPGKLVCVGDSITAGESVTPDQCYVGRLKAKAAAAGVKLDVAADGRSGWTTGDFLAHAKAVVAKVPADATVVTILLGTNDARSADSPEKVADRAADHVTKLIALYHAKAPRATFVLVGPPAVDVARLTPRLRKADYGARTPPALTAIRAAYKAAAERLGARFVDLSAVPSAGHTVDGVHPDPAGHAEIADAVWAALSTPSPTSRP